MIKKVFYPIFKQRRWIYSLSGKWNGELTVEIKKKIEQSWKGTCIQQLKSCDHEKEPRPKYYVLSMFPYPSGNLHMGHVRVYAISDAIARFYHMKGYKVIHPMGWDAFGLPAENAAIERDILPQVWTKTNIENMKTQLEELGCTFDWDMELSTCDSNYYKWTQYIFLKMYENELAYQKEAYVNWDPVDKTVLADEQVDENGCSWRSGAKIEKKLLKQWFLKATAFSKALSDGLDDPALENWRDIVKVQKHWIGNCDGTNFTFQLHNNENLEQNTITVWTNRPEALFGVSFIIVGPQHPIALRHKTSETKDLKLTAVARHPVTDASIPIFLSHDYPFFEGTDAHLGIPSVSERDMEYAKQNHLDFVIVTTDDDQTLVHSEEFSGMSIQEAREKICSLAQTKKFGGYISSSKLRDWLISRQRFWGTPIPIIHCENCGVVPVPIEDLPVQLPANSASVGNRMKPLNNFAEWVHTICPKCSRPSLRETDTMDTFVDSSWYFLRFLDSKNSSEPFRKDVAEQKMPVDIYIGGKEHAAMHLYYARFVNHFLHSIGLNPHREPFKRLLVQGMVMGQTFVSKETGRYLKKEAVEQIGDNYVEKDTKLPVTSKLEKMSKSRHNGVDPKDVLQEYGVDTTRLLMLANFAPTSNRDWPATTFPGVLAWQHRVWRTLTEFINARKLLETTAHDNLSDDIFKQHEEKLFQNRNYYLKNVTHNFHTTFQLSVAISYMQGLSNCLRQMPPTIVRNSLHYERTLGDLIIMLAPIVPHFASEMWFAFVNHSTKQSSDFDWSGDNVLAQKWPTIDLYYNLELIARINGVQFHSIGIPLRELNVLTKDEAIELLLKENAVTKYTCGNPIKANFYLYPSYEATVNFYIKGVYLDKKANKQKLKT